MRFVATALSVLCLVVVGHAANATRPPAAALDSARQQAAAALALIRGAAAPAGGAEDVERTSLGANLAHYANNPGADPARFESFVEAARRILGGGGVEKQAPDATAAQLDKIAANVLATLRELESSRGFTADAQAATTLLELRSRALLARFHARRMIAAVHFNLFKRGLRLAELVAATFAEKDAVVVWRELVAQAGPHPLADAWRAELKKLEAQLKDLEEQCCPPDEAILKEKVWEPVAGGAPRAK